MSDALKKFLAHNEEPVGEVYIRRYGIHFKLKAITDEELEQIKKQCTYAKGEGSDREEEFNDSEFRNTIIARGVTEPDFAHPDVLKKFGAPDAAHAVGKALLPGEKVKVQSAILKLCGFDDDDVEEAKN